jgi:hypothetical protein
MAISPADIAAMKQRIKKDLNALDEQRSRLTAEYEAAELLEKRVIAEQAERQLPLEAIPTAATVGDSTVSFAEGVRRAIAEFKDATFSVRDVENMLKAMNVSLPPNNLRPRIAGEIKGEIIRKRVLLVEKGSGHVPHKYRRVLQSIPETERALMRPRALSTQH